MQQPSKRGTPDFILLSLTFLLTGFGIVMVFSSSSALTSIEPYNDALYYTRRQIMFAAIGIVAMLFVMNIRYVKLKTWFIPFYFLIVIMLIIVLFRDPTRGARSWLQISSFGIQPSEFAKLGVILYLAALISKKGERFRDFKTGLLPVMVIVGFTAGLIMLQPDFGTAMLLVLVSGIMIIAGGARFKHIFVLGGTIALSLALTVSIYVLFTEDLGFRFARIRTFINPWEDPLGRGYQIIQSLYAFGHGGLTGAGFGQSIQKLHYLPDAHTDFIFAIIGEEFGFIGSALFLLVFLSLIWRGLIISLRCTDIFGTLVGVGIVSMIAIQAFINIGGVTKAIPLTGVPLPFISYGGSSLLATLLSMGILLSISRENNREGK